MTEVKKLVSPFDLYKSDSAKENAGVWIPIGPYQFKLARAGGGNNEFKKLGSQRFKPYAAAIQNDTLPEAIAMQLTVEIFVETVVKDWKDVGDADGNPLPFSKEKCAELFEQLPDLFAEVRDASMRVANFRADVREAIAGN
jgi:hypothetical protein